METGHYNFLNMFLHYCTCVENSIKRWKQKTSYLFDLCHDGVWARVQKMLLIPLLLPLFVTRSRFIPPFWGSFASPFLLLLLREQRPGKVWGAVRVWLKNKDNT